MKDKNLKLIIDEVQSQVSALADPPDIVKLLINLVEALVEKTDKLEKENQQLKVRHESATMLAAESAAEKVPTQHISYPALGMSW